MGTLMSAIGFTLSRHPSITQPYYKSVAVAGPRISQHWNTQRFSPNQHTKQLLLHWTLDKNMLRRKCTPSGSKSCCFWEEPSQELCPLVPCGLEGTVSSPECIIVSCFLNTFLFWLARGFLSHRWPGEDGNLWAALPLQCLSGSSDCEWSLQGSRGCGLLRTWLEVFGVRFALAVLFLSHEHHPYLASVLCFVLKPVLPFVRGWLRPLLGGVFAALWLWSVYHVLESPGDCNVPCEPAASRSLHLDGTGRDGSVAFVISSRGHCVAKVQMKGFSSKWKNCRLSKQLPWLYGYRTQACGACKVVEMLNRINSVAALCWAKTQTCTDCDWKIKSDLLVLVWAGCLEWMAADS